jgi:hypothetical protein
MTPGHGSKRSQQEEAAIVALLSEPTIAEAAGKVGIGERTLLRWLADPDFGTRYREARRRALDQAVSGLQQAAGKAVAVLVTIAEDQTAPPAARVSAARTVLDQAFRGMEVLDLADRIEQLERGRKGDETA